LNQWLEKFFLLQETPYIRKETTPKY